MAENTNQAKRHWWNNLADVYRVTKRVYPWIGWVILGITLVLVAISLGIDIYLGSSWLSYLFHIIFAVGIALLANTFLLTRLANKAMYKQLDGVRGNVYAVLGSIKRGWTVEQEPVAFNRKQDLVWRIVGRAGIVLISEGPHSRVGELLREEEKKCKRVAQSVPVHCIESGNENGQVGIANLLKTINKLKKTVGKEEVPVIANRLRSLQTRNLQMPKGIDPSKMKINRRALRGK